jgi:hypothetical protein
MFGEAAAATEVWYWYIAVESTATAAPPHTKANRFLRAIFALIDGLPPELSHRSGGRVSKQSQEEGAARAE